MDEGEVVTEASPVVHVTHCYSMGTDVLGRRIRTCRTPNLLTDRE